MSDVYIADSKCPYCGHVFNAIGAFDHNETPGPGSIVVCIACARPLLVEEQMGVRKFTSDELIELANGPDWPDVSRAIARIKHMHAVTRGMRS